MSSCFALEPRLSLFGSYEVRVITVGRIIREIKKKLGHLGVRTVSIMRTV